MYAMVNVQQYQIVATGNTVSDCQQRYHELLIENQILAEEEPEPEPEIELLKVSGKIEEIRSANIDGNTIYYLRLEKGKVYYTVNAKEYPLAVILDVGDSVDISYAPSEEMLVEAEELEIKK